MRRIEQAVLNRVLRRVTSRACPSTVARSGRDGEAVDCFNVTIFKGDEPDLVLLQIIEDEVRCLRYDGNRYSIEVTVPLSQIDPDALHVTHFYGLDTVEYEGTWSVALGLWLGWPCAWLLANRLWNAIAQRLFNRRSLPARGRLDLLREIFAATSGATEAVEALDLITARHGDH